MAGEWRQSSIGELCDSGVADLQTGPFGSQLHAHDYVEVGVPVVPTEAIRNRQIDHSVLPQISPRKAGELARHRLQLGDILFARRGVQATGHIGCIREAEVGFICGTGAIRLRVTKSKGAVDADFLSHVLANPAAVEWFKFHAIGATMPNLNEGIIRSFPLSVPPLPEQRAIAHILGTLDDKIELNRRMNETLESMAQALFKSWFVDFDPVRARAEGGNTGLPDHIAALFPDSFDGSELGGIPFGWPARPLRAVLKEVNERVAGMVVPEYSSTNRGLQLRSERFSKKLSKSNANNKVVRRGDFVFGLSRKILNFGVMKDDLGCVSPAYKVLAVEEGSIAPDLLEQVMRMKPAYFYGAVSASSREGQSVSLDGLGALRFVQPSKSIQEAYYQLEAPFSRRSRNIEVESRILAALRDTLLPKLISGDLRLKDAERFVEAVA